MIKCQRPQGRADYQTPTSSHIRQSDTSISPLSLPLPLKKIQKKSVTSSAFSGVSSDAPFAPTWTYLHSAAPLCVWFPMLPLHASSCPEVALLFLVPDGSVLCDSAVSCKQTILIGRCYSWVWKHVPQALSPLCSRILGRGTFGPKQQSVLECQQQVKALNISLHYFILKVILIIALCTCMCIQHCHHLTGLARGSWQAIKCGLMTN